MGLCRQNCACAGLFYCQHERRLPMELKKIPLPERIRKINGSFAWIDHCLLRSGFILTMSLEEIAVYLFLALAADKYGVSYYYLDNICKILGLSLQDFHKAKRGLIEKGLIAFKPYSTYDPNGFYQVLSIDGLNPKSFLR